MRMIFLFIDGLGLGERDGSVNPVYDAQVPTLRRILEDPGTYKVDACLGVKGLPQSATGQTAIFTGENASQVLGRHLHGRPTITLRGLIQKNNLFRELRAMGCSVTNANVYRVEYLEKMLDPQDRRNQPSVTSVMCLSEGIPFRTHEDYQKGRGLYHDITGRVLIEYGYDVERITPREAARRLYAISRDFDFTLFEHFMSDIIGHRMKREEAVLEAQLLDEFLEALLGLCDPEQDILFMISDHGNLEDISVKTHTLNPVPAAIIGRLPEGPELKLKSLTDVTPAVVEIFRRSRRAIGN